MSLYVCLWVYVAVFTPAPHQFISPAGPVFNLWLHIHSSPPRPLLRGKYYHEFLLGVTIVLLYFCKYTLLSSPCGWKGPQRFQTSSHSLICQLCCLAIILKPNCLTHTTAKLRSCVLCHAPGSSLTFTLSVNTHFNLVKV